MFKVIKENWEDSSPSPSPEPIESHSNTGPEPNDDIRHYLCMTPEPVNPVKSILDVKAVKANLPVDAKKIQPVKTNATGKGFKAVRPTPVRPTPVRPLRAQNPSPSPTEDDYEYELVKMDKKMGIHCVL